jgi:carboxyl-terminal processing protease
MRRLPGLCLSVLAWLIGAAATAGEPPGSSTLPIAERAWIASQVYSLVNTYFGHWRAVPDLDFDRAFRVYLDEVLASADRRAFDLASMALIARLKNGHSGFGDRWLRETYGQPLGFAARPIGADWVVTHSEVAGLAPGDVILGIDGRPFEDFFQAQRRYIAASDERWARRALCEHPYLFPGAFTLELDRGRQLRITRRGEFRWPGQDAAPVAAAEDDGVLWIRIESFASPSFEQAAVAAVRAHPGARAIVLDVRGNHGGSTPEKLLGALMNKPYRWWSESTPASIGVFRYEGSMGAHADLSWFGDVTQPEEGAYGGAVVLLADGGCFSACEDFVVSFKDNHRATIVGEPTAGSSGQPFQKAFGNGMGLGLSTKRESFPDGSVFEGVGIVPDVEVRMTAEDLRAGRDPALAKARELAGHAAAR